MKVDYTNERMMVGRPKEEPGYNIDIYAFN